MCRHARPIYRCIQKYTGDKEEVNVCHSTRISTFASVKVKICEPGLLHQVLAYFSLSQGTLFKS